eukprot:Filipodium_phascolosomae@DN3887_c0_g1_i1.p1
MRPYDDDDKNTKFAKQSVILNCPTPAKIAGFLLPVLLVLVFLIQWQDDPGPDPPQQTDHNHNTQGNTPHESANNPIHRLYQSQQNKKCDKHYFFSLRKEETLPSLLYQRQMPPGGRPASTGVDLQAGDGYYGWEDLADFEELIDASCMEVLSSFSPKISCETPLACSFGKSYSYLLQESSVKWSSAAKQRRSHNSYSSRGQQLNVWTLWGDVCAHTCKTYFHNRRHKWYAWVGLQPGPTHFHQRPPGKGGKGQYPNEGPVGQAEYNGAKRRIKSVLRSTGSRS